MAQERWKESHSDGSVGFGFWVVMLALVLILMSLASGKCVTDGAANSVQRAVYNSKW